MADIETRLRTGLSEAAGEVRYARTVPPELARSVRRRRAWRLAAATSGVAVVALAVASVPLLRGTSDVVGPDRQAASSSGTAVSALPRAPLAARVRSASAWTGREFFVWGGSRGTQTATEAFDDGATYDPVSGTWRALPVAPITGRVGAVAVWTGKEVLVWGGNDSTPGPTTPPDGALFNPATRTWRRIAPAPGGRVFARGFSLSGQVVIAGGDTPTGAPESALVYDPATDDWRTIPTPPHVVDAAATPTAVVALSVHPATGAVALVAIDPARAVAGHVPAPPLPSGRPQRVGLASASGEIALAVTANDVTRVMVLDADGDWRVTSKATGFQPPVQIGFDPDTTPLVWVGDWLVSSSERGVQRLDATTGRVTQVHLGDGSTSCGAGAAEAWTGVALISWGGQSCRAGSASVATGVLVRP